MQEPSLCLLALHQRQRPCSSAVTALLARQAMPASAWLHANLVKYTAKMAHQYNKKSRPQVFQVGQTVGLMIPSVAREKLDDKFILCMVIGKKHHGYSLRCEGGLIQGLIATDQLTVWEPAHTIEFTAKDDVGQLKQLSIPAAARLATRANNQPSRCGCTAGCNNARCRKAGVQCTARCHTGNKCNNWGEH